jgi:hypothetical protein
MFKKHYTLDQARALIPQLRVWLGELERAREKLSSIEQRLGGLVASGNDLGGEAINSSIVALVEIKGVLRKFESREIFIKDLDRGLVDFPSMRGGKEIFLCWEKDEDDIEFWHDLESGYSGREPL